MYKNTLRNTLYPIFLAIAVVAGIFIGSFYRRVPEIPGTRPLRGSSVADNKLVQTLTLIQSLYLDPVNLDSISESALPVLLENLDPHSVYIPAKDFLAANQNLDAEFDGVGIVFNMSTDTILVLNVIPGGPSDKAGIQNGDRIIRIDDSLVAGHQLNQDDIVKMLRGKRGSTVQLSIHRSGIQGLVPVTVERGIIPIKSMTAAFMISPGTAYIKLASFAKNSHTEIDTALTRLRSEGMTKLIFDLRGNTGGFLDQAIDIANDFLPAGKLIVYTEDKYKQRTEEYSDGKGKFTDIELAVLIDEGSASSSEILAGAIQDNDRGVVIGRRSFGKGLVQQQIPFRDGSAIRLTIARYFTPTGRSIQKPYTEGAEGNREYGEDFRNRFEHNELFTADSIKFDESLRFTTPGGKVVYGGGGIMPDVFVPLDTTEISRYYLQVTGRNILYRYTIEYSDRHRERINSVQTIEQLNTLLDSDPRLLEDFVSYAAAQGVRRDPEGIEESRNLLTALLRAYIGRNTPLEDTGFYSEIYPEDNVIMKAIEILQGGE